MTRTYVEVYGVVDGAEPQVEAKPVTPIGLLVAEVLRRHPDWTQSAIASRAGLERSVLNAYIHTPGRVMKQSTREALAKAMRIEQWEIDEAAAEQAGYEIRRPVPDLDEHRLLSRINDLPADQAARWHRLARALADALAAEHDRPMNEQSSDDDLSRQRSLVVRTDRFTSSNNETVTQADAGELVPQSDAERDYVDTLSDAALDRLRRRLLGE